MHPWAAEKEKRVGSASEMRRGVAWRDGALLSVARRGFVGGEMDWSACLRCSFKTAAFGSVSCVSFTAADLCFETPGESCVLAKLNTPLCCALL